MVATGAAAAATVLAHAAPAIAAESGGATSGALTVHELPKLDYAYDALEPHIDAQTMELHHSKHHAAYVKGLNEAEQELAKARSANEFPLIQHWSRRAAFNGGGHFLHSIFWKSMMPAGKGGGGDPKGALLKKINEDFGSVAAFKGQFAAAANAVEASGWALLHYRPSDKRLLILQAENQHKLSPWGTEVILGIDVWEHAYYLKYQNRRADYVTAWWNVVAWDRVAERLDSAQRA